MRLMTFSVAALTLDHVTSRPNPQDEVIIFTEQLPRTSRPSTRSDRPTLLPKSAFPKTPLCADPRSTFCENVTNYPSSDRLRSSIRYSREEFVEIFGPVALRGKGGIEEDDLEDMRICRPETKIFYPKAAKNEEDKWMFVVNDVSYVQAVVSEVCVEGSECLDVGDNLPVGFRSRCKQLFAVKRLLALGPSDKRAHIASFRFPSCCVCYVQFPLGRTQTGAKTVT